MAEKNFTAQVERNFVDYRVNDEQDKVMRDIRRGCKVLGELLDVACPNSREKSLALTKLEECMFWANAAIARPND